MRTPGRSRWHRVGRALVVLAALALSFRPVLTGRCGATEHRGPHAAMAAGHHGAPGSLPRSDQRKSRSAHECDVMLACAVAVLPGALAPGTSSITVHPLPSRDIASLASADRSLDPPPPRA